MKRIIPVAIAASLLTASSAFAQTPPSSPPATAPSVQPAPPAQTLPILTEAEAKALIDSQVVSSDGKNVGEVAAIQRDADGKVTELHADIGGFLGIGQTRVRLMPSQFLVSDNRVRLTLTAEQVNSLPKVEK